MVELIVNFASFAAILLLVAAALMARLALAAAALLGYGDPAWFDAG